MIIIIIIIYDRYDLHFSKDTITLILDKWYMIRKQCELANSIHKRPNSVPFDFIHNFVHLLRSGRLLSVLTECLPDGNDL